MRLCRVVGNVVAAVKHPVYRGRALMVVQPIDGSGRDTGASFLAVDQAQAGPGDRVLVLTEGNGVRQILQMGGQVPIRSLIVGVVDQVDVQVDVAPQPPVPAESPSTSSGTKIDTHATGKERR